MSSLPKYAMPDGSPPDYDLLLKELCNDTCCIKSSYYYIRKYNNQFQLCRIIYGNGKVFFHEIVDYSKEGVSEEDIELATNLDIGSLTIPDHYIISPHIEAKLRSLH